MVSLQAVRFGSQQVASSSSKAQEQPVRAIRQQQPPVSQEKAQQAKGHTFLA